MMISKCGGASSCRQMCEMFVEELNVIDYSVSSAGTFKV